MPYKKIFHKTVPKYLRKAINTCNVSVFDERKKYIHNINDLNNYVNYINYLMMNEGTSESRRIMIDDE